MDRTPATLRRLDADGSTPSKTLLVVLAFLVQTAALSQLPFLQENTVAKAGLTLVEFVVFGVMAWIVRTVPGLARWLGIVAALVVVRFAYAWFIGYLRYDSTLAGALQEGRFGLLIVITPVAFAFFRFMTVRKLGELLFGLAIGVIIADILVTWFFVRTGYLSLGGRGANRYVISVIPLILAIWIRTIVSIRTGEPPRYGDLGVLIFSLLHIALFSTSRTEAVLCCSVIGQWVYVRLPHLRWPLLAVVFGVLYFAYVSIQPSGDTQVAGRDYRLALIYTRDAFPFGVGLVPEAIQKSQLGTAGTFFASDYGPILLVYRYGVVGIVIGFAMLYLWIRFFLQTLAIPGTFIVAFGILFYFMIVPLLDYGSVIGGLLLGAMVAVMVAVPVRERQALAAPAIDRLTTRKAYS